MKPTKVLHRAIATAALALAPALAAAQAWPDRPVRWIVSQPAGSGPDLVARAVAEPLARLWGQPVVVDNRPGGQNVIGTQAAARSAPDGYTFFYGTTAAIVTNAFTFRTLPYDPVRDFVAVALVGKSPFVVAANNEFGARTLPEAFGLARQRPGQLSFATEGPKTFSGMLADSVHLAAGVRLNHVSYTRAGEAIQDTIGGRTQLLYLPLAAVSGQIGAGRLTPLAVTTATRHPSFPAVPTVGETLAGYEFTGWNILFAPAGTPAPIVERVNRDLDRVLKDPALAAKLLALGPVVEGAGTPESVAAFVAAERERWARITQAIGVVPE